MKLKKGLRLFTLSILVIGQFLPTMSVIAETIDDSPIKNIHKMEGVEEAIDELKETTESLENDDHQLIEEFTTDLKEVDPVDEESLSENETSMKEEQLTANFVTPADLGNEEWLINVVTNQAQNKYPGSSVETGDIPKSFLEEITSIRLESRGLTGQVPEEIGNLVNLERFQIRNNAFFGKLPTSLFSMRNLITLQLDRNSFEGELPETVELPRLAEFLIHQNNITGEIPSSLSNLSNVHRLSLNDNQLTGEIPSYLGNLPKLQTLNLSNNQFTGVIPEGVANIISGLENPIISGVGNNGVTLDNPEIYGAGFENTFVGSVSNWKLVSKSTIMAEEMIYPFDENTTTYFGLAREVETEKLGLFETHVFSIYAGSPHESNLIYEGIASDDVSFPREAVGYYTVVLDGAINNPNNVVRIEQENNLTAEAIPQTFDLGGRFTEEQIQSFVSNVVLNGNSLTKEEYELSLTTEPNTTVAGRTVQAVVKVIVKETNIKIELNVPVTVNWGDAIRFNGRDDVSAGVFNWHPSLESITARRGTTSTTGNVHSNFSTTYYSFSLHDLDGGSRRAIGNNTRIYSYDVRGTQTINSAVSEFGEGSGEVKAKVGDVIEVFHREPSRLRQYNRTSGSASRVNSLNNRAFFELTSSGYNLLTFDRVTPIPTTIQAGITNEELDANVSDYLNLSETTNVSVVGFREYPDTSRIGTSTGIIRVEERLTTGQFVLRDYEVPFTVESGLLTLSKVANGDFNFGELKQLSRKQKISAIGEEAPTITISNYSDATQWSLYASASPFRSDANKELKGAGITLKDLKIVESVHSWITVPSRDVLLSTTPQLMGIMANPNGIYGDEHGQTIIQIGEAKNDSLTGVSLNLPANTAKDQGVYQTTIIWELVGDPTIGGSR